MGDSFPGPHIAPPTRGFELGSWPCWCLGRRGSTWLGVQPWLRSAGRLLISFAIGCRHELLRPLWKILASIFAGNF